MAAEVQSVSIEHERGQTWEDLGNVCCVEKGIKSSLRSADRCFSSESNAQEDTCCPFQGFTTIVQPSIVL